MIPDAVPERLTLPALAPPPPRAPFPFVATAAPVLVSLGIWAVTGSVYSLLFAALGPVVAVGSMLDGRRQRRRGTARDSERAVAALESARHRVRELHERERVRLTQLAPPLRQVCLPSRVAANWERGVLDSDPSDVAPVPVRVGIATQAPVVVIDGGAGALAPEDDLPSAVRTALGEVRRVASELDDAPWLVDARDGIGIVGPLPAARALTRSVVLQLAAACSPQTTRIVSAGSADLDEEWLAALPHVAGPAAEQGAQIAFRLIGQKQQLIVACASERAGLPAGVGVVIDVAPNGHEATRPPARIEFLGAARATDAANALAALAVERGLGAAQRILPPAVRLAEVLAASEHGDTGQPPTGPSLRAPVGRDATGVIELDLVCDGPHAVVAGTTGAGKSELLVSWVLAMAARHPPTAVTFLLVDFKGGAAFSPLAGLPHVIGTVSDLDARRSARAIESLRAELLRRERVLAERGVRSIDELEREPGGGGDAGLARLVIVVDEFAAVVSGQPELHELFADLSARGRSLGLHLILCAQRPSGVVRDAVLANVTMRISLRVTDRGDSVAMLGTDAATMLPPSLRGRALIADGSGATREVQLAIAEPGDAERLCSAAPRPLDTIWCDPLPELMPLAPLLLEAAAEATVAAATSEDAAGRGAGIPFGRVDLPAEQRQPIARHDPGVDGHLLILGAARSGRTTVLRTIAAGATASGVECIVIPDDPAEAWSVLTELLERPARGDPGVVLLDDLDLLLGRVDPDTRHELTELLTRFVRGARGRSLVVSAQRLSGGVQSLAGLLDGRLLLRQPSRDEHVLSGGDGAAFDPRLPPGAARWTGGRGGGAAVQVAIGDAALPPAELVVLPMLRPGQEGRPLAVVCPRPAELARRWAQTGARVVVLGDDPVPDEQQLRVSRGAVPLLLLGDPDAWQAEWGLLSLVRREFSFAVIGCGASELRAVTRARDLPPPLGRRDGECWWVEDGSVRRAMLASPESSGGSAD